MTIDAHQHFWKYDPVKHVWIDDTMSGIRRDFLPHDLAKVYAEHGVDGCVAVQADQTLQETEFLLNLAHEYDFIKGVVGWADLRAPNIQAVLEGYEAQEKLKGWRHIVQEEADHNFMLRPDFLKGLSCLEALGHTYDILIFPHQLGAALELVKRFPNQPFVIDHLAKPYIKDGFFDGWALVMKEIACCENVYCKVSGMITEADFENWTQAQLEPYMELVLEAFGTDRLMYGSDWPVCLVAGTYGQVKATVVDFIKTLSESEQKAILGLNAVAFYNL